MRKNRIIFTIGIVAILLLMNTLKISHQENYAEAKTTSKERYRSQTQENPIKKYRKGCSKIGQFDENYGNSYDIFVEKRITRTIAYIADGWGGLVILEVSNPTKPRFLGSYTNTTEANAVYVKNKVAYVTQWNDGMIILDVSNPSSPKKIGEYEESSNPWALFSKGEHLFIADGYEGMIILDVSNPAEPREINKRMVDGWGIYDIQFQEQYAFVIGNKLEIWDISDLTNIKIISSLVVSDSLCFGLFVDEQIVYIFRWNQGMFVVSIEDITQPEVIAWYYDQRFQFFDGWGFESVLYILCEYSGLLVVNITDPINIEKIDEKILPGNYYNLFSLENRIYLADYQGGIKIFEMKEEPQELTLVGYFRDAGEAFEVLVEESIAYVANGLNGLVILDVKNPRRPKLLSNYYSEKVYYNCIAKQGELVYLLNNYGLGLDVYNVSDPKNPQKLPTFNAMYNHPVSSYNEIIVEGSYAYALTAISGMWGPYSTLRIMNISNPENITEINEIVYGNHYMRDLQIQNETLFLGSYNGLYILNISDPTNLQQIAIFSSYYNRVYAITLHEEYAFLAIYNFGLKIVNISDLTNPREIAEYKTTMDAYFGGGKGISYNQGYVFMIDEDEGLLIFDVKTITEPKIVGQFYEITDQYWIRREIYGMNLKSVDVDDNVIYLAASLDGIIVVAFDQLPIDWMPRPMFYTFIFVPIAIGIVLGVGIYRRESKKRNSS